MTIDDARMTLALVQEAVAANRSLWVELELDPSQELVSDPDLYTPSTDPLHVTLAFFGKGHAPATVEALYDYAHALALWLPPLELRVHGIARFRGSAAEGDPVVLLVGHPRVRHAAAELRHRFDLRSDFDYTPHLTLGRVPQGDTLPVHPYSSRFSRLRFPSLAVCAGEQRASLPLSGAA